MFNKHLTAPLETIKVLDFSTLLPGPLATLLLADMGAHVIKIESPLRPDPIRTLPPFSEGTSVVHAFLNRGKRSLALDLKEPKAVEVVKKLVNTHDVLVESFRPGVMRRLGLDYNMLRTINPKLVYCSITGYGQTGPYHKKAGHDCNFLALSGLMSYTGSRKTGPAPMGTQMADIAGGSYPAVIAILAALLAREKTGEGQWLDVSIADTTLWLNALAIPAYLNIGEVPSYETTTLNGGSFYGYYQTKDGRYLSVGCLEPYFWKTFCVLVDRPEWVDRNKGFGENKDAALQQDIAQIIVQKTQAEWHATFESQDACVEPVLTLQEAFKHPHFKSRELVMTVQGKRQQLSFPVKFAGCKMSHPVPGAALGEHTEEILRELSI